MGLTIDLRFNLSRLGTIGIYYRVFVCLDKVLHFSRGKYEINIPNGFFFCNYEIHRILKSFLVQLYCETETTF